MWADVLNKLKQGMGFMKFRLEVMNVEVDYDDGVESKNTSERISGEISEEANELNTVKNRLS